MDEREEQRHAGEHQDEGDGHRQGRDERGVPASHTAQHDEREDEGGGEDTQGHLGDPAGEELAQQPRGELAARQLHDHHGDREDQAGDRDHRARNGAEQAAGGVGVATEEVGQVAAELCIDARQQQSEQQGAGTDQGGQHPEGRPQALPPAHRVGVTHRSHGSPHGARPGLVLVVSHAVILPFPGAGWWASRFDDGDPMAST